MAISAFKALSECSFLMSATASPCGVDDGASTPFWTAVPLGVTLGTMASAGRSMGGGVVVVVVVVSSLAFLSLAVVVVGAGAAEVGVWLVGGPAAAGARGGRRPPGGRA